MAVNGRLDESELTAIPGGALRDDAAGAWLAMRRHIGKNKGIWICPTSRRTAYRTFADQQYFYNLWRSGRGALAAVPGTSNHGWGLAVDLPRADMQAAVRECGHQFGWGIKGGKLTSDAPSEEWHCTYHPGVFKAPPKPPHVHPYRRMNERERAARDVLVRQRRIARRHGGWDKVDDFHLEKAVAAKKELRQCARNIAAAAKDTGWDKNYRKVRFDYIKKLIGD
jgi:D-alanyl-D-alanine carboxypeptidase-like protein